MKPGSKKWKLMMSKIYGFGGAIVIVGALFKIMHWPTASFWLVAGLGTEAFIFIMSAFEPLHEDPDWTLVYPELALGHDDMEDDEEMREQISNERKSKQIQAGAANELDQLLSQANIDSETIERFGTGLKSLSDNVGQMSQITEVSVANDEYVSNLRSASERVGKLSSSYEKASESILGLTNTQSEASSFRRRDDESF